MLDISSWNLSQAGYTRFYVEWCENWRCLKSSIFNVFKNLIVIILQSEMWFIIFFLKSKMPLNLCWNMKFQKIRSTRTAWKQSQHFMKYIWSHGRTSHKSSLNSQKRVLQHWPVFLETLRVIWCKILTLTPCWHLNPLLIHPLFDIPLLRIIYWNSILQCELSLFLEKILQKKRIFSKK